MDDESSAAPPPNESAAPTPPSPGEAKVPGEDWATRYKYLYADFENYRRRTERDREGISRQSRGGMLRELLPIIEAFRAARTAVAALPPDDPVRRGMELLDQEWSTFLKHEGVEPVAVVGRSFRPDEEEAVGETTVPAGSADGTVVEVVQQGYRFFGGLLRPAKVIVGRHVPSTAGSTALVVEKPASEDTGP
jgi:molecular chaperone GrpE